MVVLVCFKIEIDVFKIVVLSLRLRIRFHYFLKDIELTEKERIFFC